MANMLAGSRTRTGKPKIERGCQPKSMALRSLSIVEAKSNLAGLPRRDQDEPSFPVNAGLKLIHLSVGSPELNLTHPSPSQLVTRRLSSLGRCMMPARRLSVSR